jgi:hypothetical protein
MIYFVSFRLTISFTKEICIEAFIYIFWLLKSWQNLLVTIVNNPQLITLRLSSTHHTLVNWQRNPYFVEKKGLLIVSNQNHCLILLTSFFEVKKQYRSIEAQWAESVSLACHLVLRKLYVESSIDVSSKISIKLTKWF